MIKILSLFLILFIDKNKCVNAKLVLYKVIFLKNDDNVKKYTK